MLEKKCLSCEHWNSGDVEICNKCGVEFNIEEKKERVELEKLAQKPIEIPLIPIHDNDHPLIVFFKNIIRFHQVVFYAIVSFIG